MRFSLSGRIIITVLLLVLLWASWQGKDVAIQVMQQQDISARHDVDFFMEQLVLTVMDAQGLPRHRLQADGMVHHPGDDTTELSQPRLVIIGESGEDWEIEAQQGTLAAEGESLLLQGGVSLHRLAAPGEPDLQVLTDDLELDLVKEYAETAQVVNIRHGEYARLKAKGMQYDLKAGRLVLNSQVQFEYETTD